MNLTLLLVLSAGPTVSEVRADANHPVCIAVTRRRNEQISKRQDEIVQFGSPITDVEPVPDECSLPPGAEKTSAAPAINLTLDDKGMKRFIEQNCSDVMDKKGEPLPPKPAPTLAVGSTVPDPIDPMETQQKFEHCNAAYKQYHGHKAAKATVKVWTLVAGVCTADCLTILSGGVACTGASVAGSAKDYLATRNFEAAMASGMALYLGRKKAFDLAGGKLGNQIAGKAAAKAGGETAAKAGGWKPNSGACFAAAAAGLNVFRRNKTAKDTREAFKKTAQAIAALIGTEKNPTFARNNLPPLGRAPTGTGVGTGGGSATRGPGGGNGQVSGAADVPRVCGESGLGASVQCARAVDKTLPEGINDDTLKNFEKFSGISPADLLRDDSDDPTRGLTAAMGGGSGGPLSGDGAKTLASALQQLEKQVDDPAESVYASGGGGSGGGGGGGSGGDPALAEAMKALMGGLNGEQTMGGDAPVAEVNMTEAKMNRSPAAIENDRALSLFERVTYRYKTVTRRMIPAAQADPASQQQPL